MRKSKFTEEQMVRIVREADKAPVADVAKKHGIGGETLYTWKRKFGGMDADDAKRLKSLETENAKLKKLRARSSFSASTSMTLRSRPTRTTPSLPPSYERRASRRSKRAVVRSRRYARTTPPLGK